MSGGKSKQQLVALRKVKEDIEKIAAESTNIAVYQFDTSNTKWNRLGVEGGAFITLATSEPKWNLIVLNRAGPDNFVLDLSSMIKVKLQPPYLMLRCATAGAPCIYGLWFHDTAERDSFVVEMETCMALAKQSKHAATPVKATKSVPVSYPEEWQQSAKKQPTLEKSAADVPAIIPLAKLEGALGKPPLETRKEITADKSDESTRISIAEVSSRLISPSDITGNVRKILKRSA